MLQNNDTGDSGFIQRIEAAYGSYIEGLRAHHPDLAGDSNKIRERIKIFDDQIMDVAKNFPVPRDYQKLAGDFFVNRNCLAKYIGDPIKSWEDYCR